VENDNSARFESVYSTRDFYVTLTESTKRFNGEGYDRHKIFLYKEDFNRFMNSLTETVNHVKTDLMPDYDYEQFERRQEEWEQKRAAEEAAGITHESSSDSSGASSESSSTSSESTEVNSETTEVSSDAETTAPEPTPESSEGTGEVSSEDDMAW